MSTVRGQQHSFSTHERMFLRKCQRFWDRKCLDLRETRTPNHRECSNHLSQIFVPCFFNTRVHVNKYAKGMNTHHTHTHTHTHTNIYIYIYKNHPKGMGTDSTVLSISQELCMCADTYAIHPRIMKNIHIKSQCYGVSTFWSIHINARWYS